MVHLYIGKGKGKTTAAFGLALRAAGSGKRVYIAQFLKDKDLPSSLVKALSGTGLSIILDRFEHQVHPRFAGKKDFSEKKVIASTAAALEKIRGFLVNEVYDLIVCDELLNSLDLGFCTPARIRGLISDAGHCELVLTGLDAPGELIDVSDYVSRIEKVKHPFDKGIKAREGIEY